jgi:hypothetical protein
MTINGANCPHKLAHTEVSGNCLLSGKYSLKRGGIARKKGAVASGGLQMVGGRSDERSSLSLEVVAKLTKI